MPSTTRYWVFNRERLVALGAFSVAFGYAVVTAAIQPLWFDELLTFYVTRLGDPVDIWIALEATADGNPPLSYYVTLISYKLFGEGQLAIRLPSLLSFLLLSYAVYLLVGERLGYIYGIVATAFLWTTTLFEYSYEARPYALLSACVAWAFLFWRRIGKDGGDRCALLGLSVTVVGAISSHYFYDRLISGLL